MRQKRPEPEPPRHRAPNGQDRVPMLVRMRRDLRDWLDARAARRDPKNTRALELEIVLDEARLKDRTGRS